MAMLDRSWLWEGSNLSFTLHMYQDYYSNTDSPIPNYMPFTITCRLHGDAYLDTQVLTWRVYINNLTHFSYMYLLHHVFVEKTNHEIIYFWGKNVLLG